MLKAIWNRIKSLRKGNRLEKIGNLKDNLLADLGNIDHKMAKEITNLAVQSCNIHRQLKILQRDSRFSREELLVFDNKAMAFEEGIYLRMEIRQIIRDIARRLEADNKACQSFLDMELNKSPQESWLSCLNNASPDKSSELETDYSRLLYVLAIFKNDIIENEEKLSGNSETKPLSSKSSKSASYFSFTKPF